MEPPGIQFSAHEERLLVIAAETGDVDARRRLVDTFLPAIAGIARRFPIGVGVQREELLQQGVTGLLCAARRYDPALNIPFWAYASFWVRKSMQELVAELTRPVALSDRAVRSLAAIRTARNEHLQGHGAEPSTADLSAATGLDRCQIDYLLGVERRPHSLDEPVTTDRGRTARVDRALADPHAEQAYDRVLDQIVLGEVRNLAQKLDGREHSVIHAHYGLDRPAQTLTQIGGALGVSAERARQIEKTALGKLRIALAQRAPIQRDLVHRTAMLS
jgi:RNA polymerase sigma factor (sigma-70 family)